MKELLDFNDFASRIYYIFISNGMSKSAWDFAGFQVKTEKELYKNMLKKECVCSCGKKVTDLDEVEWLLEFGYCLSCDHVKSEVQSC